MRVWIVHAGGTGAGSGGGASVVSELPETGCKDWARTERERGRRRKARAKKGDMVLVPG